VAIIIREATQADEPFLWAMIFEAAHMAEEGHTSVQAAKDRPDLARYVQDWGAQGDIGVIAFEPEHNQPIGAAWARLLTGDNKGYGYIDDVTPELAIGIAPSHRGRGVGTALLARLLEIAQAVYPAMSLNTRATNAPAVRLYEQMKFQKVEGSEMTNWAGGISYNMVVRFAPMAQGQTA
jgi:ribosomal protein S18 acetylase RimI-like enzyme